MGALDLKLRKEMQHELKAIQEDVGITFVYVTHDQEEALTMSDKIVVMNAVKFNKSVRQQIFITNQKTASLRTLLVTQISLKVS
ncbi:hypothetical protein MGH68_18940 [Erysipelothrix sp. D19-032]